MLKIEVLKPRVEEILQNQNGAFRIRDENFVVELGEAIEETGLPLPRVREFLGLSAYQIQYFRGRYRKLSSGDSGR